MYARRTLSPLARYVGIVGCCVVGFAATPVLAASDVKGFHVISSKSTGVKTGQYIEAAVNASYKPVGGNQRIYTKQLVPIAKSTLRAGGVAALAAGRMYPGLSIAIMAAGWVWSQQDGIQLYDDVGDEVGDFPGYDVDGYYWDGNPLGLGYHSSLQSLARAFCSKKSKSVDWSNTVNGYIHCTPSGGWMNGTMRKSGLSAPFVPQFELEQTLRSPDESDYSDLDQHVPPQLYDEIYGGDIQPDVWRDEIAAQGNDGMELSGNPSPEVTDQVRKWGDNVQAQIDGQPEPNPDLDSDGISAEDVLAEEALRNDDNPWDEPVPPFGDPEVNWQTEELSLPSYSSGVGAGACPAPVSVPMPLGGGSIDWSYQPMCDTAQMIKPAFLGVCGFVSLLIVLRARGGNG